MQNSKFCILIILPMGIREVFYMIVIGNITFYNLSAHLIFWGTFLFLRDIVTLTYVTKYLFFYGFEWQLWNLCTLQGGDSKPEITQYFIFIMVWYMQKWHWKKSFKTFKLYYFFNFMTRLEYINLLIKENWMWQISPHTALPIEKDLSVITAYSTKRTFS